MADCTTCAASLAILEALLRERGIGTGIESQSAPAKRRFKEIGVTNDGMLTAIGKVEVK